MTSRFERVCAGLGFAVLGSAVSWMVTFGVVFLVEDGAHKRAAFHAVGHGNWIAAPCVLSAFFTLIGVVYALVSDNGGA